MRAFPNLTEEQEEVLKEEARQKCLEDLHYLAKHILGYDRLTEHYHRSMAKDIDTPKYKFKLLLHPRGHFKSTLGTESYPIKKSLENPNLRCLITNAKLDNSRKFLRTIAKHFNSNPRFRWVWRDWWIKKYATEYDRATMKDKLDWVVRDVQDELTLLRPGQAREATFTTGAVDASMVSQHYGLIVADDLINREYVRTQEMVEKSILYFKDLLDLLDPDGELLVIGTRWSHMDLYAWIIEEFGHKASYSVPVHIIHGQLEEALQRAKGTPEEEKSWLISITPTSPEKPVFPEEFGPEVLQELLEAKGPYEFGAQYLLDPTPAEHQKFMEEWFKPLDLMSDTWLSTLDICITVDPAISLEDSACDSSIVVCGYDEHNRMFFLDGVSERLSEHELPEAIFDMVAKWQKKGRFLLPVGFESIGFQQLYIYTMERMMLERGLFFAIEPIARRSMSKDERILRLVPRIKNEFYIPRKIMKQPYSRQGKPYDLVEKLKWQLLKFPFAGKKDLADALADQLDIVKAHRPPRELKAAPKIPKTEFVHPSIVEDKKHRKMAAARKAKRYSGVVRC
jgi:hypothetical protein